jgi:hypothetical protein
VKTSGRHRREHLAWELMVALGPFAGEPATMRAVWSAKGNTRQHSTATLVDRYAIPSGGVRDLLVDYLSEVRPGMDYGSVEGLAYRLVRLFWWEILQINPTQADLRLDPETASQWRERLAVTTDGKPRWEIHSILFAVRGLYRDLAEWSHDEPVRWGTWVAPCPVPKRESKKASKSKNLQKARTQDRTRALTPLLPMLVAEAVRRRDESQRLFVTAATAAADELFSVDGATFRRIVAEPRYYERDRPSQIRAKLLTPNPDRPAIRLQNGLVNVTQAEADGFWAWAIVETLRHTGVRIEEMLELTQLSLRHYTSQTTGTLVPLLHIVPSKTDVERLIPMSPELVTVLLAVQRRAKADQDHVPLSVRYDPREKTHGQPFPHLFARRIGSRQEVISYAVVARLLHELATDAQLTDAGQPISFTRTTSAVCSPPRWSAAAYPCTSPPPCSGTSTSTPPAATPPSSPKTSSPPTSTSSNAAAPCDPRESCVRPPGRSGTNSRSTSSCARSPLATVTAPTERPASTNTPAPAAVSYASTQLNYLGWKK